MPGPMKSRMSMITLGVSDLGRAVDFYQHGLGFPRHGEGGEVAFFELQGTWLGLYGREALAEDAGVSAEGSGFNAFAIAHNVCSVEEVEAVMRQALEAGAEIVKQPEKVFWGGFSGYFKDPDGTQLEFAAWARPLTAKDVNHPAAQTG